MAFSKVYVLNITQVPGVFDIHMRRGEWERYFCGRDAKDNFPSHVVNVIEKGVPVKAELLPEIVTGFYYACDAKPKYTPVVILEPPGLWNPKIRSEVAYTFVKMFQQPSVSFVSSAVASLCGYVKVIIACCSYSLICLFIDLTCFNFPHS